MSDEFCLLHGYEHMRRDPRRGPVSEYCEACEAEQEATRCAYCGRGKECDCYGYLV